MKNKLSDIKKEDFKKIQSITCGSYDSGDKFALIANLNDGTQIEIGRGNLR